MIEELNQALKSYHDKWHELVEARKNKAFFEGLKPTAVGWKTVDLADFDQRFAELRPLCDQVHLGWINERWLVTMHLKDKQLTGGITIIKLMQHRPGSGNAVGLDHLDFLIPGKFEATTILAAELNLKWTKEMNGDHCRWLSIWFAATEAKLRTDTVLQACIDELTEVQDATTCRPSSNSKNF